MFIRQRPPLVLARRPERPLSRTLRGRRGATSDVRTEVAQVTDGWLPAFRVRPRAVIRVVRHKADLGCLGGAANAIAALGPVNRLQRINIGIRESYTGLVCLLSIAQL